MMIILYNSIKYWISLFNAMPRTSPLQYETIFKLNSPLSGIFFFFLFNLELWFMNEKNFFSLSNNTKNAARLIRLAREKKVYSKKNTLRSAHVQ